MDNKQNTSENNNSYIHEELFENNYVNNEILPENKENILDATTMKSKEEKQKRRKKIYFILAGVVGILLLIYIGGIFYYRTHFLPGTYINGINVSSQSQEKAIETVEKGFTNRLVILEGEDNLTDEISGNEIGLKFDKINDLTDLIENQSLYLWIFDFALLKNNDFTTSYTVDDTKLDKVISQLSIVTNPDIITPENAKIIYNGTNFEITPAIYGNQPNLTRLKNAIINALIHNNKTINLATSGLYNEPKILENNTDLILELDYYNTAANADIILNFFGERISINKDVFYSWLMTENNEVTLNQDQLNEYVASLADRFNSKTNVYTFQASNGQVYQFVNNRVWVLNQTEEANLLKEQILTGTVIEENPIWSNQGLTNNLSNIISDNYVEVSLANQNLKFIMNNVEVVNTSIVSGNVQTGNNTITGLYYILSKDTNQRVNVLYSDGSISEEIVSYWMPFTETYGIVSSGWRNEYGGDIYLTQGTDGDIDISNFSAQNLYNNVSIGTPVIIY